ncbi:hypothetical protein ACE1TF_00330 [Geomicrobium sp. JSM 1781026]|uniref:hypothetical protein n=1 Tax=Geomicrobium sp. JSM 1781026 TaxID=3344580 RepID=UPI0035C11DAE
METRDRFVFSLIVVIATGLIVFLTPGTEQMALMTVSIVFSCWSVSAYLLFYSTVTNAWFYNIWGANGLFYIAVIVLEDGRAHTVMVIMILLWLFILAIDFLFRQSRQKGD